MMTSTTDTSTSAGTSAAPCSDLSILCVTRAEPCVLHLLEQLVEDAAALGVGVVIACDGGVDFAATYARSELSSSDWARRASLVLVNSKGYIESALDEAIAATTRPYILRIDDDESISPAMMRWLAAGTYREADHWQFPRLHMWACPPNRTGRLLTLGCLLTPHLYPDFQTRLSVRSMAGGRHGVHAPSPYGAGDTAPVSIIHWKYIVRTREDRRRIAQTYDSYSPGYGTGDMKPFSLPEEAYETMRVVEAGDGSVPWVPAWETVVDNRDHGF